MFVVDSKGAQWSIDEGLRDRASALIESFQDTIGHVDLDKIIFLRLTGAAKAKWLGKCMYIGKCPMNIIPKFVTSRLMTMGMLDLTHSNVLNEENIALFDLRYIIAINDDLLQSGEGDLQKIEDITLYHELRHIHPDEDKLVKHDLEDFKDIVSLFGPYWAEGIFKDDEEDDYDEEGDTIPAPPKFPTIPMSAEMDDWQPPESN